MVYYSYTDDDSFVITTLTTPRAPHQDILSHTPNVSYLFTVIIYITNSKLVQSGSGFSLLLLFHVRQVQVQRVRNIHVTTT